MWVVQQQVPEVDVLVGAVLRPVALVGAVAVVVLGPTICHPRLGQSLLYQAIGRTDCSRWQSVAITDAINGITSKVCISRWTHFGHFLTRLL